MLCMIQICVQLDSTEIKLNNLSLLKTKIANTEKNTKIKLRAKYTLYNGNVIQYSALQYVLLDLH